MEFISLYWYRSIANEIHGHKVIHKPNNSVDSYLYEVGANEFFLDIGPNK